MDWSIKTEPVAGTTTLDTRSSSLINYSEKRLLKHSLDLYLHFYEQNMCIKKTPRIELRLDYKPSFRVFAGAHWTKPIPLAIPIAFFQILPLYAFVSMFNHRQPY